MCGIGACLGQSLARRRRRDLHLLTGFVPPNRALLPAFIEKVLKADEEGRYKIITCGVRPLLSFSALVCLRC